MKVGDRVEWDVSYNGKVINTHQGTIAAVEYWHLVIKGDQKPEHRYASPFFLCGMGDVRILED